MESYIGQLLDNRYEIIERIGVGGMAIVYKARCHRLNRFVAIKILREDLAQDGDFRRRFHDESKAVAMLSHPNIVSVYDVNRSSVSEYIVMELIDGITLKQYINKKEGMINWREALHFMIQIIKALGHAHSRGIIHRDIKPHNIMVLRDGSVKVADFGIARLVGGNSSTLTQEALGSVHYISPEQARGSRIDARSDLYSAGVVLYEMITGRLPFEGDSPVSVAIQHINSIPLSPREVNPDLPEALEAITMKAMSSKIENRYGSADEMLESLEEFRKNPSINFDYKMEVEPLEQDPSAVTQVLKPIAPAAQAQRIEDDYYESPRKRRRKHGFPWGLLTGFFAMVFFVLGVVLFVRFTLFSNNASYTIPNLQGEVYDEVLNNSTLLGGFQLVIGDTITNDLPEGTILSQAPVPQTTVSNADAVISVQVSGGPETIYMINVTNQEYSQVFVELRNMGLTVETTYLFDDIVPEGYVISYSPNENTILKSGDSVQLVVSNGQEQEEKPPVEVPSQPTVILPNFVGEPISWAESRLLDMKLNPTIKEEYSDTVPEGEIIHQVPSRDSVVEEGSDVYLEVSLGVDPSTLPQSAVKTITVALPEAPLGSEAIVTVQVIMDDSIVYTAEVDPALTTSISFDVEGTGVKTLEIFFDGTPAGNRTVNFDEVLY
ncbi:MAG: Stk1 family PASTA domain-containing Ser/Thr kinase [Eubacteriales bacterium]